MITNEELTKHLSKVVYCPLEGSNETGWFKRYGSWIGGLTGNYRYLYIDGFRIGEHRAAFFIVNGYLPPVVDHIDRNGLNNSPSNLRAATQQLNLMNSPKQKNNTTGFKGVTFNKKDRRFIAKLSVDGIQISVGRFGTALAAAHAYDQAAKLHYGEFAKLNFE
jgi:hypothetical protein